MTTASEQLARYGYTTAEAYAFIMAFVGSPSIIYQAALSAQLSNAHLAEILQQHHYPVSPDQVKGYFSNAQLNPDTLDQNLLQQQAESLNKFNLTYDSASLLKASDRIVQSLASDTQWLNTQLSYGFNTSIPSEYFGVRLTGSSAYGDLTTGWQTPSVALRLVASEVMDSINDLTKLQFSLVTHNQADIRFNMIPTASDTAAFAYYPGSGLGGMYL